MARMPQIPEPEISSRPDSRATNPEPIDSEAATRPIQQATAGAAEMGGQLESLQQQRDEAAQKLQAVGDKVTATKLAGDHAEKLRNLSDQLQQQFWDQPDKYPDEFRRQAQALTDAEIAAAPNQQIALDLAQKNAETDNQHTALAHSWMIGRTAQKAKSDVTQLMSDQVKSAEGMKTLGGLNAAIVQATKAITPLSRQVHADSEGELLKLKHDMASGWMWANGPTDPAGVRAAIDDALKTKKGPLYDNVGPKELVEYQKRSDGWAKSYGETQNFKVAAEGVDSNTKVLSAFQGKDGLTGSNIYAMERALMHQQVAIKSDPRYANSPDAKVQQSEIVQTQLDTLRALRDASTQGGQTSGKYDPKKTAALIHRVNALGQSEQRAPNDLLKVLQVQRDLAFAQRDHWISPNDAATLMDRLGLITGKNLAKNIGNPSATGPLKSPIEPDPVHQAGVSALDTFIKSGAYGRLSPEMTTAMHSEYLRMTNETAKAGRNTDEASAKKMALLAIDHVRNRFAQQKKAEGGE